jgi:hypothetical protein
MTDGLYSTVDATYEGTLEFGIVEAGDSTPTGFDFDMYALIDSGYVDSDRTIAISDLEGSATRSEISSMYITLSKDIDLYAEFVHAASLSTSLVVEEDAVYGGAVYHNEETVTTINEVAEEGSYGTGDYTETQDGSPAFRAAKAAIGGGANLATPAAIPFSSPSRKQAISSPALTPLPAAYRTAGGTPGPPTTTTPAANGNPAAMALPLRSRKPPTGFRATMP